MRRVLFALLLLGGTPAQATETRHFVLDTPRALAGSTGHGVAIFPDGSLRPLPPLVTVATFDEPLGLALVIAGDGAAYVGTGHPARVWKVKGTSKDLLAEVKADQITALAFDPDGNLFVATAAPALLLRFARATGTPEEVARLSEGNLWDLAWYRGALVLAAGNPGRLLRLFKGALQEVAKVPDRHARCLAVNGDDLLIGTSGRGLILRWDGVNPLGVVYDSSFSEIAALTAAPDRVVWAAGLTGDPSLGKAAKEEGEVTVTVSESPTPAAAVDKEKGPLTSEIVRVLPTGAAITVHKFAKQIAGTLCWNERGLVIGTGLEGELWQLVDGAAAQLDTVSASQVVRVADGGRWVLTQAPVALLHREGQPRGAFLSPPLDAGQPARWGTVRVSGELPAGAGCTVRFRSGAAATPDETWSSWTDPVPCGDAIVAAPPARYLQWQTELQPPWSEGASVGHVDVAYRQLNVPPTVKEFTAHDPGEVFLKGPPPSERVVEVQHPDLTGIFTTLDDESQERQDRPGKKYYRVGYQSLSWRVEDPNGDPLRFTVEVQRQGEERWWTVRANLETTVLALDTQALPDGLYRFRLSASDAAANPDAPMSGQALSRWVVVDNTPPQIAVTRQGDSWQVTVTDALSPVTRVEWNRDADIWHAVAPEDGTLGGRSQRCRIPVAVGRHVLAVRAVDDHHNRATVAIEEAP
jgi:hypothetical protein